MFNEKWPILPDVHNTDNTLNLVSILLGHDINDETICQTVPKCVDVNAIFLVNTSEKHWSLIQTYFCVKLSRK